MKKFKLARPLVILASADTNAAQVIEDCLGHKATKVIGHYKGITEYAFMVLFGEGEDIELMLASAVQLGRAMDQDCILYSDAYRNTFTIDCVTSKATPVGRLTQIQAEVITTLESFTFCPWNSSYWATI